jgi:hypothetical protein
MFKLIAIEDVQHAGEGKGGLPPLHTERPRLAL